MFRNSGNTALKALSALVVVTAMAACSDVPTQPRAIAPQASQLDLAPTTTTQVCADASNTTYNGAAAIVIPRNEAWHTIGSAPWIGPFANSGTTDVPVGTYVFKTTFTASEGDAIDGQLLADNGATVTIGATQTSFGATTLSDQAVVGTFQTPSGFTGVLEGKNTITVALFNSTWPIGSGHNASDPSPTGASYCFTVRTCPAAPAVANAYLKTTSIANNQKGKIVSLVAQHMGPGATFEGLGKCDPGYAAAVMAFINKQ